MTRLAAPKLPAYLFLTAALLVLGIASRSPALVVLATPLAISLGLGIAQIRRPVSFTVSLAIDRDRLLEGQACPFVLTLRPTDRCHRLDLIVLAPDGLRVQPSRVRLRDLDPEADTEVQGQLIAGRFGAYTSLEVAVRAHSLGGFLRDEAVRTVGVLLRVYPRPETLRRLIAPRQPRPAAGNLTTRYSGTGIESADIRPFQYGDELRHVNWRASSRGRGFWVNARHPERSADVVLLLDTFTDVRSHNDDGTLAKAVRASAGLAEVFLRDRERVGVIGFGGTLHWLAPGGGQRHYYQIIEALITTTLTFSYAWKDVSIIPGGILPADALVVGLTPLIDDRGIQALFDLLRRRFDVAVVEIPPAEFLPAPSDATERLARRIWELERSLLLRRYRALGAAVATWNEGRPFELIVEEVAASRRRARVHSA